jgi:hypothetical protein
MIDLRSFEARPAFPYQEFIYQLISSPQHFLQSFDGLRLLRFYFLGQGLYLFISEANLPAEDDRMAAG